MNALSWVIVVWLGLVLAVPSLWVLAALWFGESDNARHRR